VLYDPQTSGGLLIAADASAAGEVAERLSGAGVLSASIGVVQAALPGVDVRVKS
jgi:selenophosphate synthase